LKRIAVLGSTGSVGTQVLDIVRRFKDEFKVVLISASKFSDKLSSQIEEFKPEYVHVQNLSKDFNVDKKNIKILSGKEGIEFYSSLEIDLFINGISGIAGIYPTFCLLNKGKKLATANKEAIICLGEIVKDKYKDIIPIDSEHSAIFQTIKSIGINDIYKVYLTSSGGPFLYYSKRELENVSVEDAINHPKWKMGKKISVDSATLMNKGLEVIEAHYLFGLPYDKLDVVIHPQSLIHSIVELIDGTMFANLSPTDMRYPISYALFYPERKNTGIKKLNLFEINKLEFLKPDTDKFPLLKIAIEYGKKGGAFPVVLTAVDEIVVNKFLNNEIKFKDIPVLIEKVLKMSKFSKPEKIEDVFYIIEQTKSLVKEIMEV